MDDADRAELLIEAESDAVISAVASRAHGAGKSSGICLDCGEPIEYRRLHVIPWARRCGQPPGPALRDRPPGLSAGGPAVPGVPARTGGGRMRLRHTFLMARAPVAQRAAEHAVIYAATLWGKFGPALRAAKARKDEERATRHDPR